MKIDVITELNKINTKIETAKRELAMQEGRLSSTLDTLEKDFGILNIKDAEKELDKLHSDIDEIELLLEREIEMLKKKMGD